MSRFESAFLHWIDNTLPMACGVGVWGLIVWWVTQ